LHTPKCPGQFGHLLIEGGEYYAPPGVDFRPRLLNPCAALLVCTTTFQERGRIKVRCFTRHRESKRRICKAAADFVVLVVMLSAQRCNFQGTSSSYSRISTQDRHPSRDESRLYVGAAIALFTATAFWGDQE